MKKIFTLIIILMTLTACTVPQVKTPEMVAADESQVNTPNPAAAYCEKNGYEYEIRTAANGSQSGVCVFPDGSTCDEWVYFRGECGSAEPISTTPLTTPETIPNATGGYMSPGSTEEIADWWGIIKRPEPGTQYDDYFERQDLGGVICFGIDSMDPAVKAQIEVLRDSGKIVHLYGTLLSNVPDYNGSQVLVERILVDE